MKSSIVNTCRQSIFQHCFGGHRSALLRQLHQCHKHKDNSELVDRLQKSIETSIIFVESRKQHTIKPNLDQNLPFYQSKQDIATALKEQQVVVVCGETGSGKTTQLPQLCFEMGFGIQSQIAHTQPRRLAARSVAQRIAAESHTELGDKVGFKVRFAEQVSDNNALVVMTDGMLLAELNKDRFLNQYEVLIIDEAHERSLNIDLLLGIIKQLLVKRKDLKLIITSATIDTERFSEYFNQAPIINVSGRSFPVEVIYQPLDEKNADLTQAILNAIVSLNKKSPQDTLVFLPGERFIQEVAEKAQAQFKGNFEILPLYGRLSFADQQKIFKPSSRAKIVLSTNVAETSLTVPGIRYVVDSGLVRMSRYSWRNKTQGLPIEKISQASANQRSGRCGRVAAGTAIRLYAEDDFNNRPAFTDPEILRTNLATVILQMAILKMGKLDQFDFIESPDTRLIKDGYRLLHEIKAVDQHDHVTKIGRTISQFPLDPSYSKMLVTANQLNCLHEVMVIVSALSIQDPREFPKEQQQKAREIHKQWQEETSDFISYWLLWLKLQQQQKTLSNNQFRKWCISNFLNHIRVREWRDVYRQVKQITVEMGFKINSSPAATDIIHRAILSGIPTHIASLYVDDKKTQKPSKIEKSRLVDYIATRNRKLKIFPASGVKKAPKWIMANAMIQTQQLYAHDVAQCDVSWLMSDLQHLHQYEYSEPHFQARFGRISAFRNTKINNLLIEAKKRVNFSNIDPKQSRDIFIRQGLVEAEYDTQIDVINKNRRLLAFYKGEEDKLRRRELLVDDEFLYDFYQHNLPDFIVDGPAFEKWVKQASETDKQAILLKKEHVLLKQHQQSEQQFPDSINIKNQTINLEYRFNPGAENDGVTANIPLALLNQFDDSDFEMLVPGLLLQKIEVLIRSLPKQIRKNFVPVPDFAQACFDSIQNGSLLAQMSQQLKRMTGVEVALSDWNLASIDAHFHMRYHIVSDQQIHATGRSLSDIQSSFGDKAVKQFEKEVKTESPKAKELHDWDCGDIKTSILLEHSQIKAFPALVDYEQYVLLEYLDTQQQADFYHSSGIARLLFFRLKPQVKEVHKQLKTNSQLFMLYMNLGDKQQLSDDLIMASIMYVFLANKLPCNAQQFDELLKQHRAEFLLHCYESIELVQTILGLWRETSQRLADYSSHSEDYEDLTEQIHNLIYAGFIRDVSWKHLMRYPKYFLAINKRLDKLTSPSQHYVALRQQINRYWQEYITLLENEHTNTQLLDQIRWSIEEYRIASFAQPMKPAFPISSTKIERLLEQLKS